MSGMYQKAKERMWRGLINVTSTVTTVTAVGVGIGYTPNYSSHEFLSSVTSTVTTPVALQNVTYTSGKLTASGITLSTPTLECKALVVYINTGTPATSPVLCYLDNSAGLPSTPANGQITIDWDPDLGIISL